MFLTHFWLFSLHFIDCIVAFPVLSLNSNQAAKTAYFLLVGDSTTAKPKELSYGIAGGWGDGLLALLAKPASGVNYGHNGCNTVDYRSGGDFANVIKDVKAHKDSKDVYVTIQVSNKLKLRRRGIALSMKHK